MVLIVPFALDCTHFCHSCTLLHCFKQNNARFEGLEAVRYSTVPASLSRILPIKGAFFPFSVLGWVTCGDCLWLTPCWVRLRTAGRGQEGKGNIFGLWYYCEPNPLPNQIRPNSVCAGYASRFILVYPAFYLSIYLFV